MKYYTTETILTHPWHQVTSAIWQRYPNPHSWHVLAEDILQRRVVGSRLFTKRMFVKTNPIPKWGQRFVNIRQVIIVEESIVDRDSKRMITYTRNVGNYTSSMEIVERCVYEPTSTATTKMAEESTTATGTTHLKREAWIDSQIRGFSKVFERFGIERYRLNSYNATKGLNFTLNRLFPPTAAANPKLIISTDDERGSKNPSSCKS